MFGLMRPPNCCPSKKTDSAYHYHRMHYCGTCKAIGNQFDHRSRMMLNYDSVFLSELLSHLNEENLSGWEENFQKINVCWSMPKGEALPFSLEYAGAASVLLGELKVDDHLKDSSKLTLPMFKGLTWRFAQRFYSKAFQKAAKKFHQWDIDTTTIYIAIEEQAKRENENLSFPSLNACLAYYAEATAQITAQIFEEGGKRTSSTDTNLFELGYQFGKLMYILDAFEDLERDNFTNQFNPLAIYWGKGRSLNESQLEQVRSVILALQDSVCHELDTLPLTSETKSVYQSRLVSNLALRLYQERIIPTTFKERLVQRWNFAKDFASQVTCPPPSWLRQINYYMIVLAVFISPQTTEYLPQEGKIELFKWGAFITATLASIGIAGVIRRKSRSERRQERKQKRSIKRSMRKLFSKKSKHRSCIDCCNCWGGFCSNCGDMGNCCDGCDTEGPLFWVIIVLAILLVLAAIIFSVWLLLL